MLHLVHEVRREMVLQHEIPHASEGLDNSFTLIDDIDAILLLRNHPFKAVYLATNDLEAAQNLGFYLIFHDVHIIPPGGIQRQQMCYTRNL
jgi:hypothetical protein